MRQLENEEGSSDIFFFTYRARQACQTTFSTIGDSFAGDHNRVEKFPELHPSILTSGNPSSKDHSVWSFLSTLSPFISTGEWGVDSWRLGGGRRSWPICRGSRSDLVEVYITTKRGIPYVFFLGCILLTEAYGPVFKACKYGEHLDEGKLFLSFFICFLEILPPW